MNKIFSEILSMSVDSAWLIIAVLVARAVMQKAPMYFRKILWGLVGLRLIIPFSFKSAFSLVPDEVPQMSDRVAGQIVAPAVEKVSHSQMLHLFCGLLWVLLFCFTELSAI